MAPTDVAPKPPTSPRPPDTPPGSPTYTPDDNSLVHVSPQGGSIDCFEHTVEELVHALEKVYTRNKTEDTKLETTKHVEAEKPKIRASKLEFKVVDEVHVGSSVATLLLTFPSSWDDSTPKYKIVDSAALPKNLNMQGSRGALFQITLASHGYNFVGKGTRDVFIPDLMHEGRIYDRLNSLQGKLLSVYLRNIYLDLL